MIITHQVMFKFWTGAGQAAVAGDGRSGVLFRFEWEWDKWLDAK